MEFFAVIALLLVACFLCALIIRMGIRAYKEDTFEKTAALMLVLAILALALALLMVFRGFIP